MNKTVLSKELQVRQLQAELSAQRGLAMESRVARLAVLSPRALRERDAKVNNVGRKLGVALFTVETIPEGSITVVKEKTSIGHPSFSRIASLPLGEFTLIRAVYGASEEFSRYAIHVETGNGLSALSEIAAIGPLSINRRSVGDVARCEESLEYFQAIYEETGLSLPSDLPQLD